jgi:hypothetical protein
MKSVDGMALSMVKEQLTHLRTKKVDEEEFKNLMA